MEYLERMQKTAHRMQELLDDLLLYSQVSVQTEPLQSTNLEITLIHLLEDFNLPPCKFPENIKIGFLPKYRSQSLSNEAVVSESHFKFHQVSEGGSASSNRNSRETN
jgi:light-regulated signal transduction histidine kinase (bacteriophytochrome)